MKISTKGRYGLRALVDLAVYGKNGHQALGQIARRQGISEIYLEQVFSALRKNNIVQSIKGAQGGYLLAVDPKELTVGRVLRVLEGDISIVDYKKAEGENEQSPLTQCINKMVWKKIDESICKLVDEMTLDQLMKEYEKKMGIHAPMYYI